jgi:hypothetical protein
MITTPCPLLEKEGETIKRTHNRGLRERVWNA